MQRVYGLVDDELVHQIDRAAGEAKVSRAQWIRIAIEYYLHRIGEQEHLDTVKLSEELESLRMEKVNLLTALDEKIREITNLKETLAMKEGELEVKSGELDRLRIQLENSNQLWDELRKLRSEVSTLKRDLEEARSKNTKLESDLNATRKEASRAIADAEIHKVKLESYMNALKVKDDEIAFLRATIHQLTQKLPPALPPDESEMKKRHWWHLKFWK